MAERYVSRIYISNLYKLSVTKLFISEINSEFVS